MSRNGFTPTRAALVLVLVGGLFMVGKLVNPPPPGPPADAPKQGAAAPAQDTSQKPSQAEVQKRMKDQIKAFQKSNKLAQDRENLEKKYNGGKLLPKDDGISPVYFSNSTMGAAGIAQTQKEAAHIKQVNDAVNKDILKEQLADAKASGEPVPPVTPPVGVSQLPSPPGKK